MQTLMDEMSQQSEAKSEQLERERAQLELQLNEARKNAVVVREEFDQYKVAVVVVVVVVVTKC